jgi:hypothetical protein
VFVGNNYFTITANGGALLATGATAWTNGLLSKDLFTSIEFQKTSGYVGDFLNRSFGLTFTISAKTTDAPILR